MTQKTANSAPRFRGKGDIALAAGVVLILGLMLIPLPTWFLDIMLSFSISLSFLVLLTAMFMISPLEFSIFPTLLLVTTLLRLGLNVASTRLILLNGDKGAAAAGDIIQSFAEYVVGGSYVVGAVIFLILFILNKVVITSGTTRIAEVAARFTLDAMPGKQMAIEADLNSGIITEQEAIEQRKNIRREADFYGAMDGAGKFVQGDVTAGMFITFINIIGGIIIGVWQFGLSFQDALQTYSLLTIGDGLVSTIPSIIISVSAGIIVSRAAAESKMGEEFLTQLTYNSKVLKIVSGILFLLGIVPGLPLVPFWTFSILLFITTRILGNSDVAVDTAGAGGKKALGGGGGGGGGIGALGQDVDLDLGLRAGGPDNGAGAIGHLKAQHVGPGELHVRPPAAGAVGDGAVGVVLELEDLHAGDLRRGILPQRLHQIRHIPQAVQAGHHQVVGVLGVTAVLLIQALQGVR